MFDALIDRLQKLLAVKSIVTIALTIVFCVMCLGGYIGPDLFMTIYVTVIAFYFGTQAEKKAEQGVEIEEVSPAFEKIEPGGEEKNESGLPKGLNENGNS